MPTDQRHPLGVTDTPEPRSARQTINDVDVAVHPVDALDLEHHVIGEDLGDSAR